VAGDDRPKRALGWVFAALCCLLGAGLRIRTALHDPGFDVHDSRGMLRSDPGLLVYLTQRIVEAHGAVPDDFRADPRIEHPDLTDVPATFTIGQEFAVAWAYLLVGGAMPLHVFCVWAMGGWASVVALGAYGLARELGARIGCAMLAAAWTTATLANYRTVGWILMSEDFSVPWLALHLWLLARAARVRTPASILLASLTLGLAVSTWHAMSFFVALEAACVFAAFQVGYGNPFRARGSWILLATLLAFACAVPVLRSTGFALSLPMQILLALWIAARPAWRRPRLVAWIALFVAAAASYGIAKTTGRGLGEYGHVFALLLAKVRHLGVMPQDPKELSPEVRIMWQGPFSSLDPALLARLLGLGLVALVPATIRIVRAARARRSGVAADPEAVLCALAFASVVVAGMIGRTVLLPGLLLPVVGSVALARVFAVRWLRALPWVAWIAVGVQGAFAFEEVASTPISWYQPPVRETEIVDLVTAIPDVVPEGEAIAADFMTSTAILAQTGHPILFQPKWETRRTRERILEMFDAFYHRTPEELRRLLLEKYRCRYVAVDRSFFGIQHASWYAAGLPSGKPERGSCAQILLSRDAGVLATIPGYRLLYRSPENLHFRTGEPTDFYRVFELSP
jgi:hypothetical protein